MTRLEAKLSAWDTNPTIKLVGLILSTSLPVCFSSFGLAWKLGVEAETIRSKLDNVTVQHARLEADVKDIRLKHDGLEIKVARCCHTLSKVQGFGIIRTSW
jgi:hypothetical protein